MSRMAIAALIWLGVDILLAAAAGPVIVFVFIPGLIRGWGRHDVLYMVDVLLPNIVLMIVPGAIVASVYLLIASRLSRN